MSRAESLKLNVAFAIRCYKNPDRKPAYSAEFASGSSGSKGSNSDYGGENEQGTQIKSEESESSIGRGYTRGRGRVFFRGRGVPEGFRQKVLGLAHETLLTEH